MIVIPQAEAEPILQPYLQRISDAFSRGAGRWRRFTALMPEDAADISRRGQSNMLYDFISHELEREFRGDRPHVCTDRKAGFLVVIFEGRLALRVKKFKANHMYETSGIRTQQRVMWEQQRLPLVGVDTVTHAVAGYFLDDLRQSLKSVAVACRNGRYLEWVIPVPDMLNGAAGNPMPLPYVPIDPAVPIVRVSKSTSDLQEAE